MGLFKGKRKRGLYFAQKKKTTYAKNKLCYTKEDSPFPKRLKISPSFRTSTPYKRVSPSKCHTPHSSRKQLFDISDHDINDINNLTDEFSVLDISDRLYAFRYTDKLTSSDVLSNSESSNVEKLIPSVLNEMEKAGKGNLLQKFFSQVSCGKFPLNNIAFQLWCDVVD